MTFKVTMPFTFFPLQSLHMWHPLHHVTLFHQDMAPGADTEEYLETNKAGQLQPPSGTLQCQASVFSWCQFKKDGRARVLLHPARDLKSTFTKEQTAENHFLKKIFRLLLCKSMNQTWGRARFITLKTTMRRNPRTHLEA